MAIHSPIGPVAEERDAETEALETGGDFLLQWKVMYDE